MEVDPVMLVSPARMLDGVPRIITQHADEAAFQWLLRDAAVHAPHYDLNDLARLDERVEAHIDGLRIAGDAGWELCREQFSWNEAGEMFAGGVLAFESRDQSRVDELLEASIGSPEAVRGVISALGWIDADCARQHIDRFLGSDDPQHRRIGLAAASIRRHDPGRTLVAAVNDDDPALRARALRAVGELGRADLISFLGDAYIADDLRCQYWAGWSLCRFAAPQAAEPLMAIAEAGQENAEAACRYAVRAMNVAAGQDWIRQLWSNDVRLAVIATGANGDASSVPRLIEALEDPDLAACAGESITTITGVDFEDLDLICDRPGGADSGPNEDPADEHVSLDADEDLPWASPKLVAEWWRENAAQYQTGVRLLCGSPLEVDGLLNVMGTATQRNRTAAALELARLQSGQSLFETRAPAIQQQRLLSSNCGS